MLNQTICCLTPKSPRVPTPKFYRSVIPGVRVRRPDAFGVDNSTLLAALSFQGGTALADAARLLLHHAVAALLNASHPGVDYPRTPASIIADVNAALASGSRSTMLALKNQLDSDNNLGCPLN